MKAKELKKKTPEELEKELTSAQLEIVKLKAQLSTGAAAKEAGKLTNLKKKIARIKTIQNMN
jgi:ribosomal protein L29